MEREQNRMKKRGYLFFTLGVCLGLLVYFKYANFLLSSCISVLNFFGCSLSQITLDLLLPVGISFYTFQTLSYVIDVYRGKVSAEKHFGYFALFVSFFPQLVAGPIERPQDLIPQLKAEKSFSFDCLSNGVKFLLSGFLRKCVIADVIALVVNGVYADLSLVNGVSIFIASFFFLIQMYNDFAGYSEIALGSAHLLGIRLSKNFDCPLISASYTEFFRRWHITLNQWFTDYVYIPLGGNRKGSVRKIVNTLVVFLLCGLWHGANWTFVLWGGVAGAFVCAEGLLRKPVRTFCEKHRLSLRKGYLLWLRRAVILFCFTLSAILFRSQSIEDVVIAFLRIFTFSDGMSLFELSKITLQDGAFILIVCALMAFLPKLTAEKTSFLLREREKTATDGALLIVGIFLIVFCWLDVTSNVGISAFQYFQF